MKLSNRLVSVLLMIAFVVRVASVAAAELPEKRTARYLASIHPNSSLLIPFLRAMPKGGDLHIHLAGAISERAKAQWKLEMEFTQFEKKY